MLDYNRNIASDRKGICRCMTEPVCHLFRSEDGVEVAVVVVVQSYSRTVRGGRLRRGIIMSCLKQVRRRRIVRLALLWVAFVSVYLLGNALVYGKLPTYQH